MANKHIKPIKWFNIVLLTINTRNEINKWWIFKDWIRLFNWRTL
jgi:hypothetical protein